MKEENDPLRVAGTLVAQAQISMTYLNVCLDELRTGGIPADDSDWEVEEMLRDKAIADSLNYFVESLKFYNMAYNTINSTGYGHQNLLGKMTGNLALNASNPLLKDELVARLSIGRVSSSMKLRQDYGKLDDLINNHKIDDDSRKDGCGKMDEDRSEYFNIKMLELVAINGMKQCLEIRDRVIPAALQLREKYRDAPDFQKKEFRLDYNIKLLDMLEKRVQPELDSINSIQDFN